jgi:glycine betaine/proline transport system substrate-binding protein
MRMPAALVAAAILAAAAPAGATDPESCAKVRMADGGWTDNTAQNGLAAAVLKGLGYEVDATVYAMPVILKGLENKDLDIWLDNWMPSQTAEVTPYFEKGSIANLKVNLTGAGYGPVVPSYVAASGVKDLADLGKYGPRFDKKF